MEVAQIKKQYDDLSDMQKYASWGVAALLLIGAVAYFKGKSSGNTYVPLPENSNSSETEAQLIRKMSLALYNEMKGLALNSSIQPFKNYLEAPDRLFIAVYNDFNSMYENEGSILGIIGGKSTLRDWIKSEFWGITDFFGGENSNSAIKNAIINRMNTLNLQ